MKRRSFIHKSGLGALAFVLMPWGRLWASSTSVQTFSIPDGGEHLRHGLMTSMNDLQVGPSWLTGIRRDVFFANGIGPSKDDWHCYSIRLNNQWISATPSAGGVVLMLDEGPIEFPYHQFKAPVRVDRFSISLDGNRLKINNSEEWIQIQLEKTNQPSFRYGRT
ncbi:hypothetical protein KFE98_16055 [bacterium SCSIO 12741]|nr:hypothetical protein KFE98_16055 [bacterium SCSIO 12741]